jgi:hypothetical protein
MPRWDRIYPESARPRREAIAFGLAADAVPEEPGIFRLILGRDEKPVRMTEADIERLLNDPLAVHILRKGKFPRDVDAVLDELAAADALPDQETFLASEAGQIPPTDLLLDRQFRWVVARSENGKQPDLIISTGAEGDLKRAFLQILAWDETRGVFNYYQRVDKSTWIFSGDSNDSLVEPSRGKGAFDSHVNGGMVMKELLIPWQNWHSFTASIDRNLGDETLRSSPLFKNIRGAESLEPIVLGGIDRWTGRRFGAIDDSGVIANPKAILRQAVASTTFNLRTTRIESATVTDGTEISIPASLFVDDAALFNSLGIAPVVPQLTLTGKRYRAALSEFDVHLQSGAFREEGDTFFALLFPEAAAEDHAVLAEALRRGWIAPRFAACALMVDVSNPVLSNRRQALLQHVPETASLVAGALGQAMADRILASAASSSPGTPEAEFTANWALGDSWQASFADRITGYLAKVRARLNTDTGSTDYFRLIDSRRRQIRPHPLSEFDLLLPRTNIDPKAEFLEMTIDGAVQAKSN